MDVKTRFFLPMEAPITEDGGVDTKPIIARGVAVKKAEYMAMGPTPGCYGCKAILRGDAHHKPHFHECRQRVLEWLKRQDDVRVQERLTAAQLRQEAGEEKRRKEESKEEVTRKKRSREGANPGESEDTKEEANRPNRHMAPPPQAPASTCRTSGRYEATE